MHENDTLSEWMHRSTYYIVIAVLSVLTLCVFPFLGSSISASIQFPTTKSGWVIWGVTKGSICLINMIIFHSFVKQGKLNIKDDPVYLQALAILSSIKPKKTDKRAPSPAKYHASVYTKRGLSLVVTSFLSLLVFGEAILRLDYVALISYFITLVIGIVFGILQMKDEEYYWTKTFLTYAKQQKQEDDL